LDLETYLTNYNGKDYPLVLVTVDTALFTFANETLNVLLVKRAQHPHLGEWSLPGGFLDQAQDRSLEDAAKRSIKSKTGIEAPYLEQLKTLGSKDRDPRGWSVTTAYTALIPFEKCASFVDSVSDTQWWPIDEALSLPLAFDHQAIIELALERHHQKALYSFVPVFGMSEPFTITQLRKCHETFLGKPIQRKSFIRRFEASNMFIDTGKIKTERGRPATLYTAKHEVKDFRFVRNLED
jgi:ADP-ribose pyrophosphatase YjhB (NUDIX family)